MRPEWILINQDLTADIQLSESCRRCGEEEESTWQIWNMENFNLFIILFFFSVLSFAVLLSPGKRSYFGFKYRVLSRLTALRERI